MPNCNYCSQTLNPRHVRLLRVTFEPMQRNWKESLVQSNCITDRENLIGVGGVRISPRRIQKHRQTGPTVLAALCFKRLWERPMTSTVRKRAIALAPKVPRHDFSCITSCGVADVDRMVERRSAGNGEIVQQ